MDKTTHNDPYPSTYVHHSFNHIFTSGHSGAHTHPTLQASPLIYLEAPLQQATYLLAKIITQTQAPIDTLELLQQHYVQYESNHQHCFSDSAAVANAENNYDAIFSMIPYSSPSLTQSPYDNDDDDEEADPIDSNTNLQQQQQQLTAKKLFSTEKQCYLTTIIEGRTMKQGNIDLDTLLTSQRHRDQNSHTTINPSLLHLKSEPDWSPLIVSSQYYQHLGDYMVDPTPTPTNHHFLESVGSTGKNSIKSTANTGTTATISSLLSPTFGPHNSSLANPTPQQLLATLFTITYGETGGAVIPRLGILYKAIVSVMNPTHLAAFGYNNISHLFTTMLPHAHNQNISSTHVLYKNITNIHLYNNTPVTSSTQGYTHLFCCAMNNVVSSGQTSAYSNKKYHTCLCSLRVSITASRVNSKALLDTRIPARPYGEDIASDDIHPEINIIHRNSISKNTFSHTTQRFDSDTMRNETDDDKDDSEEDDYNDNDIEDVNYRYDNITALLFASRHTYHLPYDHVSLQPHENNNSLKQEENDSSRFSQSDRNNGDDDNDGDDHDNDHDDDDNDDDLGLDGFTQLDGDDPEDVLFSGIEVDHSHTIDHSTMNCHDINDHIATKLQRTEQNSVDYKTNENAQDNKDVQNGLELSQFEHISGDLDTPAFGLTLQLWFHAKNPSYYNNNIKINISTPFYDEGALELRKHVCNCTLLSEIDVDLNTINPFAENQFSSDDKSSISSRKKKKQIENGQKLLNKYNMWLDIISTEMSNINASEDNEEFRKSGKISANRQKQWDKLSSIKSNIRDLLKSTRASMKENEESNDAFGENGKEFDYDAENIQNHEINQILSESMTLLTQYIHMMYLEYQSYLETPYGYCTLMLVKQNAKIKKNKNIFLSQNQLQRSKIRLLSNSTTQQDIQTVILTHMAIPTTHHVVVNSTYHSHGVNINEDGYDPMETPEGICTQLSTALYTTTLAKTTQRQKNMMYYTISLTNYQCNKQQQVVQLKSVQKAFHDSFKQYRATYKQQIEKTKDFPPSYLMTDYIGYFDDSKYTHHRRPALPKPLDEYYHDYLLHKTTTENAPENTSNNGGMGVENENEHDNLLEKNLIQNNSIISSNSSHTPSASESFYEEEESEKRRTKILLNTPILSSTSSNPMSTSNVSSTSLTLYQLYKYYTTSMMVSHAPAQNDQPIVVDDIPNASFSRTILLQGAYYTTWQQYLQTTHLATYSLPIPTINQHHNCYLKNHKKSKMSSNIINPSDICVLCQNNIKLLSYVLVEPRFDPMALSYLGIHSPLANVWSQSTNPQYCSHYNSGFHVASGHTVLSKLVDSIDNPAQWIVDQNGPISSHFDQTRHKRNGSEHNSDVFRISWPLYHAITQYPATQRINTFRGNTQNSYESHIFSNTSSLGTHSNSPLSSMGEKIVFCPYTSPHFLDIENMDDSGVKNDELYQHFKQTLLMSLNSVIYNPKNSQNRQEFPTNTITETLNTSSIPFRYNLLVINLLPLIYDMVLRYSTTSVTARITKELTQYYFSPSPTAQISSKISPLHSQDCVYAQNVDNTGPIPQPGINFGGQHSIDQNRITPVLIDDITDDIFALNGVTDTQPPQNVDYQSIITKNPHTSTTNPLVSPPSSPIDPVPFSNRKTVLDENDLDFHLEQTVVSTPPTCSRAFSTCPSSQGSDVDIAEEELPLENRKREYNKKNIKQLKSSLKTLIPSLPALHLMPQSDEYSVMTNTLDHSTFTSREEEDEISTEGELEESDVEEEDDSYVQVSSPSHANYSNNHSTTANNKSVESLDPFRTTLTEASLYLCNDVYLSYDVYITNALANLSIPFDIALEMSLHDDSTENGSNPLQKYLIPEKNQRDPKINANIMVSEVNIEDLFESVVVKQDPDPWATFDPEMFQQSPFE